MRRLRSPEETSIPPLSSPDIGVFGFELDHKMGVGREFEALILPLSDN